MSCDRLHSQWLHGLPGTSYLDRRRPRRDSFGGCSRPEACSLNSCIPVQECLDCRGTLLFTGIGKSGFIAQKVCQTLVSTGTKAVYLSPTDALHGDIGIVGREDLVVLVSKSGATEELLRLVPYAKVC